MEIALIISGFGIGLLGSMHCVGMCGPLALALPTGKLSFTSRIAAIVLYNLGRAFTYALIGALIGMIGSSLSVFVAQQWISLVSGIIILINLLFNFTSLELKARPLAFIYNLIRKRLGTLFDSKLPVPSYLGFGLLNGLLPCGLVYVAMAVALSGGTVFSAMGFMFAFGLGTFPLMLTAMLLKGFTPPKARITFKKITPAILLLTGLLLVLRGSGLGIPYISPKMVQQSNSQPIPECHQ